MSEIFKLYQQQNIDVIGKIIVYIGDLYVDDIDTLFVSEPDNDIFKDIFSEHEMKNIMDNNIPVTFTKQRLYLDDSIETIKKKIMIEYADSIAFEEIYLYTKQIQQLNDTHIYDNLTQGGKITLTKDILFQFISNIKDLNVNNIPIKDIYDFNDIVSLNLSTSKHVVSVPLGQHFITSDDIYNYSVEPYKSINFSRILQNHADSIITTTNRDLLLSQRFIFENTIYLCNVNDVLSYAINKKLSEKTTIEIYYPYLI